MTEVVHCKLPAFDSVNNPDHVYIGRPSKWGNPFSHKSGTLAKYAVGTRAEAIARFREWALAQPRYCAMARAELRGKTLGCWCAPLACHGEVLAEIADSD